MIFYAGEQKIAVFKKVGYFYEIYNDDAIILSELLDLKVMRRFKHKKPDTINNPLLIGFHINQLDKYSTRLKDHGYKIETV